MTYHAVVPIMLFNLCCPAGVQTHTVETAYQRGRREIRILVPDAVPAAADRRVLYVLPVEKGFARRFGYGLGVLEKMDAHNRYGIIIVQPGFAVEPWFGDHATDPQVRQASYLREFVVPFVEKRFGVRPAPEHRLLLGFSKSGWGAFSLILRYPDFFGYAAAWDAPLMFRRFHYGMKRVYGTRAQLDRFRPDLLARRQKRFFRKRCRLVLAGEKDWGRSIPAPGGGSHTAAFHALLDRAGIRHRYDDTLRVPHRWDRAWMAPVLKALVSLAGGEESDGNRAR